MNDSLAQTYIVAITIHLAGIGIAFYLWTENRRSSTLPRPKGDCCSLIAGDGGFDAFELRELLMNGRRYFAGHSALE